MLSLLRVSFSQFIVIFLFNARNALIEWNEINSCTDYQLIGGDMATTTTAAASSDCLNGDSVEAFAGISSSPFLDGSKCAHVY